MGASEGLQSLFSYSSDPVFPLFSLQLRVLGDWYEFEYRLDHHCHVTLYYVFHSMSLACFLPRVFVLISWLDIPLHFVITHMMLWDMFIGHLFTLYAYHGLSTSLLRWILDSIFNPMLIFSLRKGERRIFTSTLFSRESP